MAFFSKLFNRSEDSSPQKHRQVSGAYQGMREQLFSMDPRTLGLDPDTTTNPIWAFLMETAYPEGVVSLLATVEGTVSLYFSSGGGTIGLGQHAEPAAISAELLAMAEDFLPKFQPTEDRSLPELTITRIYLLTFDKTFAAEAPEDTLSNDQHEISPLFHKAHELITAIRAVNDKLNRDKPPDMP